MKTRKNALLVTVRNEIATMYKSELDQVFHDLINISTYSFEDSHEIEFPISISQTADVILVTSNNVYSLIRNYITPSQKVLYINFTFTKAKIDKLKNLPIDSNAYIGFKSYSASFKTISLLHELGVKNLNLKIYDPKTVSLSDIDFGIVSENSNIFPPTFKNLFFIGERKIHFQTLLDISTYFNIFNAVIESRIEEYTEETATPTNSIDYLQDQRHFSEIKFQTIINNMDDGLLMLDENGIILDYNKQFKEIFKIQQDITNMNISSIKETSMLHSFFVHETISEKLLNLQNLNLLILKSIIYSRELKDNIKLFLIKNTTDIMKLQNLLKKELKKRGHIAKYDFSYLIGSSALMQSTVNKAKLIASIDKSTLIYGESGTGKEIFAQSIHNNSVRRNFPFIAVNCAALPSTLLESELFGYVDGSFTGASKSGRIGLFESAHLGTLFLDEIGEISLETQAKLLRVLEEHEIRRVGSNDVISIDVKIIAATNKNLRQLVQEGKFRLDLFFRLNTIMIKIPPLRDRKTDIKDLIEHFLSQEHKSNLHISDELWEFFYSYAWEGNIRELKNTIEYIAIIANGVAQLEHLPDYLKEEIDEYIKEPISDQDLCAIILSELQKNSLGRRNLTKKLHELGFDITEYKIRNILNELSQLEYIELPTGRKGATLTAKGLSLLSANTN